MHTNAVSKSPFIQVAELKCLRYVQGRRRMSRRSDHVEVLRLAHILQQVIDVTSRRGPILAHRVKERNEGATQVSTHHWPPQNPCAEISDC